MITSNLVFSEWERIFKEPMATAAAIDRLVHHSAILEFNAPSYRIAARRRTGAPPADGEPVTVKRGASLGSDMGRKKHPLWQGRHRIVSYSGAGWTRTPG